MIYFFMFVASIMSTTLFILIGFALTWLIQHWGGYNTTIGKKGTQVFGGVFAGLFIVTFLMGIPVVGEAIQQQEQVESIYGE
jgi:hypothetical protein